MSIHKVMLSSLAHGDMKKAGCSLCEQMESSAHIVWSLEGPDEANFHHLCVKGRQDGEVPTTLLSLLSRI